MSNNKKEVIYESAAETAKKIRKELKKNFPNTKFSVRSSTFSMGSSVDVRWTDGATYAEVNKIASKFQSGHFDGMQDMYVSGSYEYEEKFYNGAKYVDCSRTTTENYTKMLENYLDTTLGDWEDLKGDWRCYDRKIKEAEEELNELHEEALKENSPITESEPQHPTIEINHQFTIEKTQHTKTNADIWVCKLVDKVSKEEFKSVLTDIQSKGGYYSKFVKGFIFNEDPTEILNNIDNSEEVPIYKEVEEIKKDEKIININNYKKKEGDNMNIFDKFDNIEIGSDEKISHADKEFCEMYTEAYTETMNTYKNMLCSFIALYNKQITTLTDYNGNSVESYGAYISEYGDFGINKIVGAIIDLKESYISKICSYFNNKYSVSIDYQKIYAKHKDVELPYEKRKNGDKTFNTNRIDYKEITYNIIIDEIFIQLGGFTFEEKAVQELKEKTRKTYYYNDYREESNITIKNNKIIIDGGYAYKDSIWNEYRLSGNFSHIFTALYHFDNGLLSNAKTELHEEYCGYENERNQHKYEKYKPNTLEKTTAIKFFKNGKLELEFKNNEYARQFAIEYCGYSEQVA